MIIKQVTIGPAMLYCGDCLELLPTLGAGGQGAMRQRASPTRPPAGRGPGGPPQGGVRAPSGGGLQGIPTVRRVIGERGGATLRSRNERAGTAGAPQAITVPHSAAVRRRERR